ncbi:ATP-dependent endonuclease [Flavobacterium sp. IB48]|uniref:ATP-dependent nuclease n=1 Tax=Flavobacterium sp. IB48 TaxID=2779375 RepID=UPI0018E82056|nr:AAA family ATPase [Flavobacterium sp. IB48]MBJ2124343.1 AAA family ATPase [Flavobacterium sp. IB48]
MFISEIKLWNFRKYGTKSSDLNREADLVVSLNKGLNVLIGENDSGKSTILDAIKLVLKTHAYEWIKVEDSDFYQGTDKLKIEIHFSGISDKEGKHFIEWSGWGEEEVDINGKMVKQIRPKLILNYQAEVRDNRVIPSDVKAGMDGIGNLLNAEAREYLKCTYLKALRDADSELTAKKNSRLSEILQKHKLFYKEKGIDHEFETDFKEINKKIENRFKGTDSDKKYNLQIKATIDNFLEKFIDDKTISLFSLGKPEIKNILEKLNLGIVDRNNLGLGSMNRLFMAAELLHLKREWEGLKLCLIEELEAHLHPQAQMKIIEALSEEADNGIQFILTTHSPNIASKLHLKSLIICKDNTVFPLADNYTKLGKDNYKYLERFLDTTKSNLFFAKGVILVEGWSEEILIPALAQKMGYDLTAREVSFVNVASTAYLHFAKIFLRKDDKEMKVPVAIVTDLDNRPDGKGVFKPINEENKRVQTKNQNLVLLKSELEKTNITLELAKEWTLEWCLFKSSTLSELFKEAVSLVHSGTEEFRKDKNGIFKSEFQDKLISKLKKEDSTSGIEKVKIASELANGIIKQKHLAINETDEYLKYLIDAIKHACSYGKS